MAEDTRSIQRLERLNRELDDLLEGPGRQPPGRRRWRRLAIVIPATVAVMALPFLLLVRGSVHLYVDGAMNHWAALVSGALASSVIIGVIGALLYRRFTGRLRLRVITTRIALPLTGAFVIYSLLFISTDHFKSSGERRYYRDLHPILRLAVSTVALADRDIVITDGLRRPADYAAMGLPLFEESLHLVQPGGYSHAVDLRTKGRGGVRNVLLEAYFDIMGFTTLRHVGTADHLHVSLPLPR